MSWPALDAPEPPERIHSAEVDLFSMTFARFIGPDIPGGHGIWRFTYRRPDGTSLDYRRWQDEDGDWFYLPEAFSARSGVEA